MADQTGPGTLRPRWKHQNYSNAEFGKKQPELEFLMNKNLRNFLSELKNQVKYFI